MSRTQHREQSSTHMKMPINKPFLKIGEVARLMGVKPHVLRYWEAEFPSLRPKKNPSGQRIYTRVDIEAIVEIKNLLYNECYTISGAKKMLADQDRVSRPAPLCADRDNFVVAIKHLKMYIQELLMLLQP